MKNYQSISNIIAEKPHRITTGEPELDWLYGKSEFPEGSEVGMPVKTISTWCGEGGVGKSRLAIKVARYKVQNGSTVLYLQNEVDMPTLASWVKGNTELPNFYCSEVTALNEQVEIIRELKPDLVFVDSINLIDEFGTGTAKSIKKIVDGFRSAIRETGSHVVILCQLNKQNEATGSTALGHLPDTNLVLTNYEDDFRVGIGKKNRYGPKGSGYFGIWRHLTDTVKCISKNRVEFVEVSTESVPPMVDFSIKRQRDHVTDTPILRPAPPAPSYQEPVLRPAPEDRGPRLASNEEFSIWNPEEPYGDWGLLGRVVRDGFRGLLRK